MEKVVISLFFKLLFFSWMAFHGTAQEVVPPLERKVSLDFKGVPLKSALQQMEESAQFSFAYKTGIVDETISINRAYLKKTIREILDDIFQGSLTYKSKGNYILLKQKDALSNASVSLEGYIVDAITQEKIPYATIYDVETLTSTISDEYGHYFLELGKVQKVHLKIKKENYLDVDHTYNLGDQGVINFMLQPILPISKSDSLAEVLSPIKSKGIEHLKWLKLSEERKANLNNFKEMMRSQIQFSVLPNIGTNGKLSSSTTVDYSFNLLGGFVGGVRKMELAGIFNMDVDTVKYVQAAGVFNLVGGPQYGFQGAGTFNLNLSSFTGGQFAGTSNFVRGDFTGGQFAGFSNVILGKTRGVQAAGTVNFARDSSRLYQVAGFYNHAGNANQGAQVAGFMNFIGKDFKGAQFAGFMNLSRGQHVGLQVAGFLNVAKTMKGTQLGFINVSDSISGVPVGFLSYSRTGLHQLEISTNEAMTAQVAFKTGVNAFYNSFLMTGRFENHQKPIFGFGYGLGTSVRLNDRNRIFFDLQSIQLVQKNFFEPNNLNKLTVSYQFQIKKKLAIAIGPSFNFLYLYDTNLTATENLKGIAPYSIYDFSNANGRYGQMWVGGHLAIRLF